MRTGDGFLLDVDPTRGWRSGRTRILSPVADDEVLERLLARAGDVQVRHGQGKDATYKRAPLRELLVLAAYTGRRISAILGLGWSDWLPEEGTYGSLRWRADTDKLGRESVVPVHPEVQAVLEAWRQESPGIGEGHVFPAPESDGPVRVDVALSWLREAMEAAELDWPRRFGFHAFRRMWATKRKGLPLQDVAEAGGWKGTQVLRDLYQQADPETMERVVMGGRELRMGTEG